MLFLCFHPQTIASRAVIGWYHGNHGSSSNDNNGRVFTAFPTSNWNTVNLTVTSFQVCVGLTNLQTLGKLRDTASLPR